MPSFVLRPSDDVAKVECHATLYIVEQYAKTWADVSKETTMFYGGKIFQDHFASPLQNAGVTEMTLRDYKNVSFVFRHVPLGEVDETIDHLFLGHGEDIRDIVVTSCVRTANGLKRLHLLDFAVAVTLQNERTLYRALREWAEVFPEYYKQGALMRTRNSYHFVGFTPLRYNAWVRAMGTALLLGGREQSLVDRIQIGHSLRKGYAGFLVSAMGTKETPSLVTHL